MTREELIADLDEAAAQFAARIVAQNAETTGVPKKPQIEVSESQLEPEKFSFDLTHDPLSESDTPSSLPPPPPPPIVPPPPPPPAHLGACCGTSFGDCSLQTPEICAGLGGDYMGDGSFCDPLICGNASTGACCTNGDCAIMPEAECWSSGGSYMGDGTNCAPGTCPLPPCPCGYGPLDASGGPYRFATKTTYTEFDWTGSGDGATHLDWNSTQIETYDMESCLSTSTCTGSFNCTMTYTGHEGECSYTGAISGEHCSAGPGACAGCEWIPDPYKCEDCAMNMASWGDVTWVDNGLSCGPTFCSQSWTTLLPYGGSYAQMFQFQYLSNECVYSP